MKGREFIFFFSGNGVVGTLFERTLGLNSSLGSLPAEGVNVSDAASLNFAFFSVVLRRNILTIGMACSKPELKNLSGIRK